MMKRQQRKLLFGALYVVCVLLFSVFINRTYVIGKNLDSKQDAINTEWCEERGGHLTFQRYPPRTFCMKDGVEVEPQYLKSEVWIGTTP